jgi:hypothetical protein
MYIFLLHLLCSSVPRCRLSPRRAARTQRFVDLPVPALASHAAILDAMTSRASLQRTAGSAAATAALRARRLRCRRCLHCLTCMLPACMLFTAASPHILVLQPHHTLVLCLRARRCIHHLRRLWLAIRLVLLPQPLEHVPVAFIDGRHQRRHAACPYHGAQVRRAQRPESHRQATALIPNAPAVGLPTFPCPRCSTPRSSQARSPPPARTALR